MDFLKCLCCQLNIHVDVHTHKRFQTVCPDPKKTCRQLTYSLLQPSFLKKAPIRISLVVQSLRLHTSTAGGVGSTPGPETSILHAVQPKSFKKEEVSTSVTIHLTTPKQKLRNYPCLFPLVAINFSKFCGFSFITNSQNHLLHTLPNNLYSITGQHHPSLQNWISFLSRSPSPHQLIHSVYGENLQEFLKNAEQ